MTPDDHIAALLDQFTDHGLLPQHQLLPALHAIQDRLGFIPPASVAGIAQRFNLSRAEVHGVITFYHYFKSSPPARCTVQICRAEACQSMGGDTLLAHAEQALGCSLHGARRRHVCAGAGLLPGPVRHGARHDDRRDASTPR